MNKILGGYTLYLIYHIHDMVGLKIHPMNPLHLVWQQILSTIFMSLKMLYLYILIKLK